MLKGAAALFLAASWMIAAGPVKVVLVAGKPSHAHEEHEFYAGTLLLEKCLRQNAGVEPVVVKGGWPEDETVFDSARTLVFYMDGGEEHPMIADGRLAKIGALLQKGVGLVCLHYAVEVPKDRGGAEFLDWIGGYYERPYSTNPTNDVAVTQASSRHPISRGWKSFEGRDEWYYKIRFQPGDKRVTPILTTMLPKDAPQNEVIAWACQRADGGRGFGFTGGHYHRNWGIPDFRRMVVNAILWSAKLDVPRGGAKCDITPVDLAKNLDDKPVQK
jgi:type 1 glutamine amidotransferase